jgi:hypothetical protein
LLTGRPAIAAIAVDPAASMCLTIPAGNHHTAEFEEHHSDRRMISTEAHEP